MTSRSTPPSIWRSLVDRVLPPVVIGILVLVGLEAVGRAEILPRILFPSPWDVFAEMARQAVTASLWSNLWVTFQEGFIGFLLGAVIGLVFGSAIGLSRTVSRALYPYVVIVQAVPRVALAPVFIAFLGFGMASKIAIAVAIAFFPVLIGTIVGLRQVDSSALTLMRSLRASKMQIFRYVLVPSALPSVAGGLKSGMTFGFIGAIVGELIAANAGIGQLIDSAAFQLRTAAMFAYIIWLSLLSLVLFGVMEALERRFIFWTADIRDEG